MKIISKRVSDKNLICTCVAFQKKICNKCNNKIRPFKNRKQIDDFFDKETFKFSFMADGIMTFDTLNEVFIKGVLHTYTVTFFNTNNESFFCYGKTNDDFLEVHKIHTITLTNIETRNSTVLFTQKYQTKWEKHLV